MSEKIENKILNPLLMRQLFALTVIILLGLLILTPMSPYISGVFGAIIMYVLTKGWMAKLVARGWKKWLAALLMILLTILVILVPIAFITYLLFLRVQEVMQHSDKYTYMLESNIARIENYLGFDISKQLQNGDVESMVSDLFNGIMNSTLDFTIIIGLMYFILYYLLINYDSIKKVLREYTPLSTENFEWVSHQSEEMIKSNAIAIPLVAILQGVVALIGFWIFDAPNPWFWFAVTTIGSMIPFIGTALGMVPVLIIMYAQGMDWQAASLAVYGLAIVGSTDNLFRIIVQKKLAEIHPLITLFGVIIGIPLFGFLGLVFGPVIVSLFLIMVKIYKKQYADKKILNDIILLEQSDIK